MTTVGLGFLGLIVTAVVGLTASDGTSVGRHISYGFFSALITLLAHSMMMFYLIGKEKLSRMMAEGGFGASDDPHYRIYVGRIATARWPSVGTSPSPRQCRPPFWERASTPVCCPPWSTRWWAMARSRNAAAIGGDCGPGESSRVDEVNRLLILMSIDGQSALFAPVAAEGRERPGAIQVA